MPDLLKDIREQLDARLAELRPLVDEHGRLNAAMKALSETKPRAAGATPASSPVKTTSARAHKPPPAKRRKRAPRGANRQAVLRAASERPGATRAELAAVSGVDPNTLSALLARLVKAGELQTRALPTGRTGYALADSAPAQPAGA
jgi:CRP-like cAMP-binding protein